MPRGLEPQPDVGAGDDDCLPSEVILGVWQAPELGAKEVDDVLAVYMSVFRSIRVSRVVRMSLEARCTHISSAIISVKIQVKGLGARGESWAVSMVWKVKQVKSPGNGSNKHFNVCQVAHCTTLKPVTQMRYTWQPGRRVETRIWSLWAKFETSASHTVRASHLPGSSKCCINLTLQPSYIPGDLASVSRLALE